MKDYGFYDNSWFDLKDVRIENDLMIVWRVINIGRFADVREILIEG